MFKRAFYTKNIDVNSQSFKRLLSSGNEAAFKQFFETFDHKVFNYIDKIVKSKEVSEELTIDVFMKIWNTKEMLSEVQNLDAFIYRIAVNKALDFLRIAAKEKQNRTRLATQIDNVTAESADQPYLNREFEKELQLSIGQLPPQQKLIFSLSRENGLSHQQIAEQLRISKNTVKNHMVSAIRHLKSGL